MSGNTTSPHTSDGSGLLQQSSHALTPNRVLEELVHARRYVSTDRSLLVALSGIDACGKGYLAKNWQEQLIDHGFRVALIGIDGWLNLPSKRFGGKDPARHFYEHAFRFDEMFSRLVFPLRERRSIQLEADFTEETDQEYRRQVYEFHDIDVILLEGIFLLKRQFQSYYDASIWVECTMETALERALQRSQEGLLPADTIRAYQSIYFPAQKIHISEDDPVHSATGIVINDPRMANAMRGS